MELRLVYLVVYIFLEQELRESCVRPHQAAFHAISAP